MEGLFAGRGRVGRKAEQLSLLQQLSPGSSSAHLRAASSRAVFPRPDTVLGLTRVPHLGAVCLGTFPSTAGVPQELRCSEKKGSFWGNGSSA